MRAVRRLLSKQTDTDHGVKTTKTTLLEAVNKRFDQIECDPMFCIATLLDARYKDRYFDEDVKQRAQAILHAHLLPAAGAEDETCDGESAHLQRKRQRPSGAGPSLHDMFEEILEENGPERPSTSVSQQLDISLAEAPIPRESAEGNCSFLVDYGTSGTPCSVRCFHREMRCRINGRHAAMDGTSKAKKPNGLSGNR
ncbi:hypothetical protein N1851_029814 [Merluccius polli]|uniref:Uncharacterized protein n=1 Tax=Merluccius polli TaxID=89951 RepID=A0AA47M6J3_MERPO|nr:hypothetical protein N1851_029814 [Merluccius polli]